MNKGAKIANGKYIWYINSDDEAEFGSIDYILNEINNQKLDSDCLYGNMAYVRQIDGKRYEEIKKANKNLSMLKKIC